MPVCALKFSLIRFQIDSISFTTYGGRIEPQKSFSNKYFSFLKNNKGSTAIEMGFTLDEKENMYIDKEFIASQGRKGLCKDCGVDGG